VDLPAAGPGAVDPVRRAHDLVVLPALAVAFLPFPVLAAHLAVPVGEGLARPREIAEPVQKVPHHPSPVLAGIIAGRWTRRVAAACRGCPDADSGCAAASPMTGRRRTSVT